MNPTAWLPDDTLVTWAERNGVVVLDAQGNLLVADGSLTVNSDVFLISNGPSQVFTDATGPANARTFQIINTGGTTYLRPLTDAYGGIANSIQISNTTGLVYMAEAPAVVVPAATAATHAAQVSAIDATTGRLAIGGVEIGNTGWRDISASFVNGWALGAGRFLIRRVGLHVQCYFENYALDGNIATDTLILTLPAGFRCVNQRFAVVKLSANTVYELAVYSSGDVRLNTFGAGVYTATTPGPWATFEGWPSSLPGLQVTAPFTG